MLREWHFKVQYQNLQCRFAFFLFFGATLQPTVASKEQILFDIIMWLCIGEWPIEHVIMCQPSQTNCFLQSFLTNDDAFFCFKSAVRISSTNIYLFNYFHLGMILKQKAHISPSQYGGSLEGKLISVLHFERYVNSSNYPRILCCMYCENTGGIGKQRRSRRT